MFPRIKINHLYPYPYLYCANCVVGYIWIKNQLGNYLTLQTISGCWHVGPAGGWWPGTVTIVPGLLTTSLLGGGSSFYMLLAGTELRS